MGASAVIRFCLALAFATAAVKADGAHWSSGDYVDSYFRYYNGHAPLPHLRDEKSKALFNHLIDPGNIASIEESSVPDTEKLRQLRIILSVLGSYRAAYNAAIIVGEPLAEELTLIQVYNLEVTGAVADLMRVSPDGDGSAPAWATLVEGVIEEVGNTERYSPEQSNLMADAIAKYYPAIAAVLPEDERNRIRDQVLKLGDTNSAALKQMKRVLLASP